jgi:PAS domain S-box-containing protein/putative nucleotidyltransferase with HDIG domain
MFPEETAPTRGAARAGGLSTNSDVYQQIFDTLPDGVVLIGADGCITAANWAQAAMYGYGSPEDLTGVHATTLVSPSARDRGQEVLERRLRGEEFPPVEYELLRRDGTTFYGETTATILRRPDGTPSGYICTTRDTTGRRRAEEALRDSEARYRDLFEQLQFTLKGAVTALGATIELRDPYTSGHQTRVAELACAIADDLGCDEERTELLRTAARVHDIGKIVVPAEILAKPVQLSEPEMRLVRRHPSAGAEIVGLIGFHADVALMIGQHHERLDGSGYPDGLHGAEILWEARILAVADVVEAMVSHRPYRPALLFEAVMTELEDGAGRRYEPVACESAISLIRGQGWTFS